MSRGIWDRSLFATLMTGLGEAGVAVIAPDVFFDGPSPPGRGGEGSDRAFIEASKDVASVDEATAMCRRRFKNFPDRYFASVDALIQLHFEPETSIEKSISCIAKMIRHVEEGVV